MNGISSTWVMKPPPVPLQLDRLEGLVASWVTKKKTTPLGHTWNRTTDTSLITAHPLPLDCQVPAHTREHTWEHTCIHMYMWTPYNHLQY